MFSQTRENLYAFEIGTAILLSRVLLEITRLGEPVLFHPPRVVIGRLTHIAFISSDAYVVGSSDGVYNLCLAASSLLKLTLEDIERELYASSSLDVAERVIWRRWLTHENHRLERQSRTLCAGRLC